MHIRLHARGASRRKLRFYRGKIGVLLEEFRENGCNQLIILVLVQLLTRCT